MPKKSAKNVLFAGSDSGNPDEGTRQPAPNLALGPATQYLAKSADLSTRKNAIFSSKMGGLALSGPQKYPIGLLDQPGPASYAWYVGTLWG